MREKPSIQKVRKNSKYDIILDLHEYSPSASPLLVEGNIPAKTWNETLIEIFACREPVYHMHKKTDQRFITRDKGIVVLNGDFFRFNPRSHIYVPARTKHMIIPFYVVRGFLISEPKYDEEDFHEVRITKKMEKEWEKLFNSFL